MSIEENKSLVSRFFAEVVTGRNLAVVDEVKAPDIMDHRQGLGNVTTTEGTKKTYAGFLDAFPDGRADKIALIGEGDHVFWYGWGNATHTGGPFMGIPATGKRLGWAAWDYFHCINGKIVERWGTHAAINRMQQMGIIPSKQPPYTVRPIVMFSDGGGTEEVRDRNKELVWRFYHGLVNQQKPGVVDEVMAEGIIDHRDDPAPAAGTAGIKRKYASFLAAFPDARALCNVLIAEGNLVFWWGTAHGTHSGAPFMGQPPSGKKLSWRAMALFRIADERIVEMWAQHDELDLMRQLGTLPPGLRH